MLLKSPDKLIFFSSIREGDGINLPWTTNQQQISYKSSVKSTNSYTFERLVLFTVTNLLAQHFTQSIAKINHATTMKTKLVIIVHNQNIFLRLSTDLAKLTKA